jgi:hypothetical protein
MSNPEGTFPVGVGVSLPLGTAAAGRENRSLQYGTILPIGVYALSGLATDGKRLLAIDTVRGYLVSIDPDTNNTIILNPHHVSDWIGVTGLTLWEDTFWFAKGQEVLSYNRQTLTPTVFTRLPYPVTGVAVWESNVYVSCQKSGYIHVFDRNTGELLSKLPQPGVGTETLTMYKDALWVCDRDEQTVYCLDRTTGVIQFSALTPFASPTGITFYAPGAEEPTCYVAYADEEPYIRDDPNARSPYQLTFRDRTFIHPLHIHHNAAAHYTLSNGFLVEMSYVEELLPLEAVTLNNVEWRIALPSDTLRQRVRHFEPIGHEFEIEEKEGQKVAVFKFDRINPHQGGLIGWKAVIEMPKKPLAQKQTCCGRCSRFVTMSTIDCPTASSPGSTPLMSPSPVGLAPAVNMWESSSPSRV